MNNNDFELRRYARDRTQEKAAFYTHFIIYVLVNAGIVTLNLLISPGNLWFYWPLLAWGAGLLGHGVGTFAQNLRILKGMEEREYQKLKRKQGR